MKKRFTSKLCAWLLLFALLLPSGLPAQSIFEVEQDITPTIRTNQSASAAEQQNIDSSGKTGWVRADMGVIDSGQLRITPGTVNVRSGPGLGYEVLDQVHRGDRYPVVKTSSGWHNIQLTPNVDEQPTAWLRDDMCAQVGKVIIIIHDKVNLRAGPSTSHAIVATGAIGKTFPVVGAENGWTKIALVSAESMVEKSEPGLVEFAQQDFMIAYNAYTRLVIQRGRNHAETQAALREFRQKYGIYSLLAKGSQALEKVRKGESKLDKIVINKANFTSTVYANGKVVRIFPIAYGANPDAANKQRVGDKRTPEGAFSIVNKAVNPQYKTIPGGASNNPLGTRWMGLSAGWGGSIGMHGTSAPSSIGSRASAGCVRMFTADAEELFSLVKVGTPVIITGVSGKAN